MKTDSTFLPNGSTKAMNILLVNGIFSLILCMVAAPAGMMVFGQADLVMDQGQSGRTCRYTRPYSKLQVNCSAKNLGEIPSTVNTKVQIMLMSFNRLRDQLPPHTFAPYTSLENLYLGENFLNDINNTIEDLGYLQVLDISYNGFYVLPSTLFQLPYLRKLYLTHNFIGDGTFELRVTSPIQHLAIATNKLTKIPSIGPQPSLTHLNLSSNQINRLSVDDIAPFCKLSTLDITNNPINLDESSCDCHQFMTWVEIRNITLASNIACKKETLDSCSAKSFANETMVSYNECLEMIEIAEAQAVAKRTWITVGSCILAVLVCVMIGLYCVHKRNKKRAKKTKKAQRLATNNANTELLNGNLPEAV
ncbi:receptor-like protein kinase [Diprion similis]|uniref:receptor-like protein kinase n=1 Tax=Diprion similis TaxID=362088 RepID=UPI001EF81AEE|nr:receptor-like protein kinase [Diprion similis]